MGEYIFVGEKRSQTAIDHDWTWTSEHLSAIQLFGALRSLGIEPEEQEFINLWDDEGGIDLAVINYLAQIGEDRKVVALGGKVSKRLKQDEIDHTHLIHPAARGTIRLRENYLEHVKNKLIGEE